VLDVESMTVDELIGRLKPMEERINRNGGNTIASLNLTKDELVTRVSSRLKVSGTVAWTSRRRLHQVTASTDVAAERVTDQAATVVTMVEVIQAIAAVAVLGTVGPVMSQKMSVATAASVGTRLTSAGRKRKTRRLMPLKWKRKMSPHSSSPVPPSLSRTRQQSTSTKGSCSFNSVMGNVVIVHARSWIRVQLTI
jgi:hypothetical protein